MFEFHCWITIGEWKIGYKEGLRALEQEIQRINFAPLNVSFTNFNESIITISGITNRDRGYVEGVKILTEKIFTISDFSYGLVYYSKDDGIGNFEVLVIRRNSIEIKQDKWLSPWFPMIEDEDYED